MAGKKQHSASAVTKRFRLLVFVCIPLFAVNLVAGNMVIRYTKEQSSQYLLNTVELYVAAIDGTIANINRRLGLMLIDDSPDGAWPVIETIRDSGSQVEVNHAANRLINMFGALSQEYGADYHFFVYLPAREFYVRGNGAGLSQQEYRAYEQYVMDTAKGCDDGTGGQSWHSFSVGEEHHGIVRLFQQQDIFIGFWIRPEDLLAPLNRLDFGGGFAVLGDGEQLLGGQDWQQGDAAENRQHQNGIQRLGGGLFSDHLLIARDFSSAPFSVQLLITGYGNFQTVVYIQFLLLFLVVTVLGVQLAGNYYLHRKLLRPVLRFSESLEQIRDGNGSRADAQNELLELEQATRELRSLLGQVERLEIEIYQKEIQQQKIQLDFLKLQIKPHFYLNCLSFIYNMVDMGDGDTAKEMCRITADYLRYLFKNGMDLVQVWEELSHVENYLRILKLRYRSAFRYTVECDEEIAHDRIPPLLVHTFVENAIEHGIDLEEKAEISVAVFSEELDGAPYISIFVQDTGKGFSDDVLAGLEQGGAQKGDSGRGVGIANCLRRLEYTYGGRADVRFYNGAVRGAVVEIHIPAENQGTEGLRI